MRELIFMRIEERHIKLAFSTIRIAYKKPALIGENFQIVVRPIGKQGLLLGVARIIHLDIKKPDCYWGDESISDEDAVNEGWGETGKYGFLRNLFYRRGKIAHKMTLEWVSWTRVMIHFVSGGKTLEEKVVSRMGGEK
jgi:hypothetical protein